MAFSPASSRRTATQSAIGRAIGRLPEPSDMVNRVLSTFADADADDELAGLTWYGVDSDLVLQEIQLAARTAGYSLDRAQCAGILAALSPSCGWSRNCELAIELAETGDCPHAYGLCIERARAIRDGGDPDAVLGGRKVRSFYRNIVDHGRQGPVTIDRHAVAILFGRRLSDAETKVLERKGAYHVCAGAYRTAGRILGLPPHTVQAVCWVAWRRIHGIDAVEEYLADL